MEIVYTGEYDAVRISGSGQTAKRGEPVDVEDELAASLLEQVDCWRAAEVSADSHSGAESAEA